MSRWAIWAPRRLVESGYGRARLVGDLSGGLVAALIALPYGLAMASLMGLPPVMGIFTSIISAPFIAFLGRNPVLIGGTSSTTVPFMAMAVQAHGVAGGALLGIMAAAATIGMSLGRMGRHILRVPHAVVAGFSCGIGGLVVVSQLDTMLGLKSAAGTATIAPVAQLAEVCYRLGDARLAPAILGVTAIVTAVIAGRISRYLPAPLMGLLAAIGVARVLHLHEREVGPLTHALPALSGLSWKVMDILSMAPGALGMALVTAINLLLTARVVDHARGHHGALTGQDADAELRAYGVANFFAGLFGAPPSVGIPARSMAVVKCGGTTPVANLFHAAVLAAIVWLGSGLVSHIPLAALSGVTMWIGLGLLNWHMWRRLPAMNRFDAAAFLVTVVSVLVVNSVLAVFLGCLLYVVRYVRQEGMAGMRVRRGRGDGGRSDLKEKQNGEAAMARDDERMSEVEAVNE